MKKYTLILLLFLVVLSACNALGIKESDNATNGSNVEKSTGGAVNDNQMSASTQINIQAEQIAEMQKEIDELVSTLNTKDMTIVELENKVNELNTQIDELSGQVANSKAAYDNLQGMISTNNQYRNIAIIVALASILLNIILVYMLIKAKSKYSRAALPPAKKDENLVSENNTAKPEVKKETTEDNKTEEKTETKQEENAAAENRESKRGRPKKAEHTEENTETNTSAKKRGRPKKDTAN